MTDRLKEEHRRLTHERDGLKLKVEKFDQYLKVLDKEDDDATRVCLRQYQAAVKILISVPCRRNT
jgi:hypothetical protein